MLGYWRLRKPSAIFAATLRDERRIWLVREYRSSWGKVLVSLKIYIASL